MNNDELKKKMIKIIVDAIWKDAEADYDSTDETEAGVIADALIAAGIVDKSDYASMKETAVRYKAEVSKAGARAKEAEHRAEVAGMALSKVFTKTFPWCCAKVREDIVNECLQEAEKELEEDGKNHD